MYARQGALGNRALLQEALREFCVSCHFPAVLQSSAWVHIVAIGNLQGLTLQDLRLLLCWQAYKGTWKRLRSISALQNCKTCMPCMLSVSKGIATRSNRSI